jgi:hypothetical protein
MADIIEQIQRMQNQMLRLKDLILKREELTSQLASIDDQIKEVLDLRGPEAKKETPYYWDHPNDQTDASRLTEVMGEEEMHKNDIIKALHDKGYDINAQSVSFYLSNFRCFENTRRGYWKYVKS